MEKVYSSVALEDAEVDECAKAAEKYIANCKKFQLTIDPSVVIALETGWGVLKPSTTFGEGSMLPLMDILGDNKRVTKLNLADTGMKDARFRFAGNGNSNARALVTVLHRTKRIKELNLANTGLDDDGIVELCKGISKNESVEELNLSNNYFGVVGAKYLSEALGVNKSIRRVDLSGNALGFTSINALVCACQSKKMQVLTSGNYVFEEIMNSVSHGVAFLFSVVGANLLIAEAADVYRTDYHFWACVIYSFALMFLFLSSCLFHSFFMLPTTSRILQILDHVGIYLTIAGSITPLMLITLHRHNSARVLLTIEWIAAFCGITFASCSDLNAPFTTVCELIIFVCMGAGCLLVWDLLVEELSAYAFTLLNIGNVLYLLGIVFFILGEYKPIFHTIWHLFVVAAAATHWFNIYFFVVNVDLTPIESPAKAVMTELVDSVNAAANAAAHTTMNDIVDTVNAAANAAAHTTMNDLVDAATSSVETILAAAGQ